MSKHISVSANVESLISGSKVYAVSFTNQDPAVGNQALNKYVLASINNDDGIAKQLSCASGPEHPGTGSVTFTGKLYKDAANVDSTTSVNVTDTVTRSVYILSTHGITDTIANVQSV